MIREYIYFVDDNPNGTSGMTEEEVVRCKDCKWYKPKYKDKEYDCPQGLYAVYENDFCSHGERDELKKIIGGKIKFAIGERSE